jgi:hypothetical protein
MILIPELGTVLILVPRTGSGSLKRAVLAKYPRALLLYRHMEACGIPAGYDRWDRVGVVRHPVERLWSLYKFLGQGGGDSASQWPDHFDVMRASVQRPFDDWLLNNELVFTDPHDQGGSAERFYPQFNIRYALPENRKSQFTYLRPDLGTQVYAFGALAKLAGRLGVTLDRHNATAAEDPPALSAEAADYVRRVFAWDFRACCGFESFSDTPRQVIR